MGPREPHTSVTENHNEVPEGIRRARAAFLRDFDNLVADRKTRGKFVCYHNDIMIAVHSTYRGAAQVLLKNNIPENEFLIIEVTPASAHEEQLFAHDGAFDSD